VLEYFLASGLKLDKMKYLFLTTTILTYISSFGQLKTHQLSAYDSLQFNSPQKSIVFIHTDWCRYCKQMKNTTLSNIDVQNKINSFGNYFELNAEEKETIKINQIDFHFKPYGYNTGIHEAAIELGTIEGELEFPVIVFINEKNEIIGQYSGFLNNTELIKLINRLNK
jgi:thioredoxin-related protein